MKPTLAIFLLIITAAFLSCNKKDLPPAVGGTTPLMVVNAGADTVNYYVNGNRQNNTSSIYPGGNTIYVGTLVGMQNFSFKRNGSATVLFAEQFKLDSSTYYSIFITGPTADKTFFITDQIPAAVTAMAADTFHVTASLRVVNASTDSTHLDVTVGAGDTINLKNIPFKSVGAFTLIKGGKKAVKVYQTGSLTPKIDTTLTLTAGSIYTLFTKGTLNGTGNAKFGIGLITNK